MSMLWVVLFVALIGSHFGHGLPVGPTPQSYPHDAQGPTIFDGWGPENGLYAAVPALALMLTAVGLLFGCTWCYRHKDCKPNEGADNQLFAVGVSASHLHDVRVPQPPDSGFSEPVNNNISEDNNNGPISLREMQNIANNNAAAYIVSENEERNRVSRESVVEFEPLPAGIGVADPLEHCADWFGDEDFPRSNLQYLREIGRGWFGRVVEGEIEDAGSTTTVAVKILNQSATLEDKARFLDESKLYRDVRHENLLPFVAKCLQEDPWILIFEFCSMDLQQYLTTNRPKMAILNESGVPLRLMCDVTAALTHLHSIGYLYGDLWCGSVLVRGSNENARAVLGRYNATEPTFDYSAPETRRHPPVYTRSSEVWSLGSLVWSVSAWGGVPPRLPPPPPDLPCPYRNHLYQVMQLCWDHNPEARPTSAQVLSLLQHLAGSSRADSAYDDGYGSSDFEERWQRLKPNSIPIIDEHVAIVHAPSTSMASHFTGSDQEFDKTPTIQDSLSVDMGTAVSRSSSIMSDKDPLSVQIKSESLTNLHGSLEDVRNIYLTHNEMAVLECHQGNISLDDSRDKDHDRSDSSMDPWLKDIIAGSQDDVSYYKDVSDVIKNLDNILNSEKTSSSESSHQASPSRDNLSLDCKKEYPVQSSMVKSPGISNFQNILAAGLDSKSETDTAEEDDLDRDTIGTLSHSFERHSDTTSQHTLENITPITPIKDLDVINKIENEIETVAKSDLGLEDKETGISELPKEEIVICDSKVPKLKEICVASIPSLSKINNEQLNVNEDCHSSCDNKIAEERTEKEIEAKSVDDIEQTYTNDTRIKESAVNAEKLESNSKQTNEHIDLNKVQDLVLPNLTFDTFNKRIEEEKCTSDVANELKIQVPEIERPEIKKLHIHPENHSILNTFGKKEDFNSTFTVEPSNNQEVPSESTEDYSADQKLTIGGSDGPEIVLLDSQIIDRNSTQSEGERAIIEISKPHETLISNDDEKISSPINSAHTELSENLNKNNEDDKTVINDLILAIETKQDAEKICPEPAKDNRMIDKGQEMEQATITTKHIPETVQNNISKETSEDIDITGDKKTDSDLSILEKDNNLMPMLPPDIVQNIISEQTFVSEMEGRNLESHKKEEDITSSLKTELNEGVCKNIIEQSNNSTVIIDLINGTDSLVKKNSTDGNVRVPQMYPHVPSEDIAIFSVKKDSTAYLDLPSMIKETDIFLNSERIVCQIEEFKDMVSSTPKGSDRSTEDTLENSVKDNETTLLAVTKVPDDVLPLTKLEQKYVPENISPLESPTKSHHTDTYDENSSVVLGPFENCTNELFKCVKSTDLIDLPKEELLAFSSNFSEMNLETPSPLRDGNFLNEVPDIVHDDIQFDDLDSISDRKPEKDLPTDNTEESEVQSATEKRVSPSTPPNSPGIFLASTSQQKYLVDIDLNPPHGPTLVEPESSSKEIDLNQIELQITTKLAMAENENNLNIEYSGPLTVEGLVLEDSLVMRESDALPESLLAGNGGSVEDLREDLTLDEECVKALRNELELKLPLAQVAAIEPQCEAEVSDSAEAECEAWRAAPPPPELVLAYPGALSPIAEETRQQLSAYENDINWTASIRTDSSESYPEPCNNSTDDVTELPTGGPPDHSTYTVHSPDHSENHTYTVQKDITSSKEITMSADSLNASPYKKPVIEKESPIDDKTYTKNDDEKESNCERISQVSPFLVSPTTDTAPDTSDNATGVSTLSRTTVPTDAKLSKPSETQCLSKATSIDSWCSNDTLYNVEENFDDLAMDADIPLDYEPKQEEDHSDSSNTLTHNDDEKELSHCSTYIIHDSKSEACETFSPDSITANDNYTYTKAKTEGAGATPSIITKSEIDSTKSQTKDLAYGTLMSGMPSHSNCTTELLSGFDDVWKLQQPELVRKSPIGDEVHSTPPKCTESKTFVEYSPQLYSEPSIKKMDSVEITCLQDQLNDSYVKSDSCESQELLAEVKDNLNSNYRPIAASVTSTPITESGADNEDVEAIPMLLPENQTATPELSVKVPNFQVFLQSAEIRPQDISSNTSNEHVSNQDTEVLLEGDSKTLSKNSNRDSTVNVERTPTYSDFEYSLMSKPQDLQSKSSQSLESGVSSEEFRLFENMVKSCPQDLASVIDASSLLLRSERRSSELAPGPSINVELDQTSQSLSRVNDSEPVRFVDLSPPSNTNLIESRNVYVEVPMSNFLIDLDVEEETDQPHSIIITESLKDGAKDSPNRTYDSHIGAMSVDLNNTYDSHETRKLANITKKSINEYTVLPEKINGFIENENSAKTIEHMSAEDVTEKKITLIDETEIEDKNSPNTAVLEKIIEQPIVISNVAPKLDDNIPNGAMFEVKLKTQDAEEIKCNGSSEKYATVEFLNETFEELVESNVDDDAKDLCIPDNIDQTTSQDIVDTELHKDSVTSTVKENVAIHDIDIEENALQDHENDVGANGIKDDELTTVTECFLQNEKKFCQLDTYFPLLSDIRFSGPATEIMSTSFTQDSPTEPTSPECEQDNKPDVAADILKEWDSDSESHSSNSSSGEFIWKDGDGHETSVVPSTHFDHQRGEGGCGGAAGERPTEARSEGPSEGSEGSGSGSEGDEVEFVPSSWDCRAAPAKSSLRSLEQTTPDNKKRVVFKRQKYHCVYEYPREAADLDSHSPASYLPDLSTYSEWDPSSVEDAELGYGQLFGAPNPLDIYSLRSGIALSADYDEDFFISSSARPFESLGIMSTTSQFFPGMHVKSSLLERELGDEAIEDFPPPPSPLPTATLVQTRTPSLDFTTPDSGVEDITPGSTSTEEDYKAKKLPEAELTQCWRPVDSGSSSESVSPSSPGGEALGGLRHTRDKLKLDLPPSPHLPSPRHNRVFNFVLDKPKRQRVQEERQELGTTPLVMTDETPIVTTTLPLQECEELPMPEPTFSTFGKCAPKSEPEQKGIILTDDAHEVQDAETGEVNVESPKVVEAVKGEGTVLDSGDEDSGIESSSKATLERNKTTPNVS